MPVTYRLGAACLFAVCACGGGDKPAASTPADSMIAQARAVAASNTPPPALQPTAAVAAEAPPLDAGHAAQTVSSTPPQASAMDAATVSVAVQPIDAGHHDAGHAQVAAPDAGRPASTDAGPPPVKGCKPAAKPADMGVHFHHVHMLSMNPEADMQFYEKYFSSQTTEYCRSEDGTKKTLATKTERGWFLYDKVTQPPDDRLNCYLEHIGWINPDPAAELQRLVEAGAPLYPEGRGQCPEAVMGKAPCNNYWFYLRAPNGAKIEDALGPGPATMGWGHVHFVMGVNFDWFSKATDGAIKDQLIDQVNHTDVAVEESNLNGEMIMDSRGKSIDHLGYSVPDLEAHRARVLAQGLEIAEDISFKSEFGFRSFFMRSEKGIWIEFVEDAAFTP